MVARILSALILLIACSAYADCPPPMVGKMVTTVRYLPAENWSKFEDNFEAHIAFLNEQMQAGVIQYAGPFIRDDKQLNGGFAVYNLTDLNKVGSIAAKDALVKAKVVSY